MSYCNNNNNKLALLDYFPQSVQLLDHVRLFATPWTAALQASLSVTNSSSRWCHPTICCPLLLPPSIFSSIRVFSSKSVILIRWPKDWSFSFSISPSNKYLGLISFRIDWFDLLAVHGTFKNLLQHRSSKASTLHLSNFFVVQHSQPYVTTGKTIPLTIVFTHTHTHTYILWIGFWTKSLNLRTRDNWKKIFSRFLWSWGLKKLAKIEKHLMFQYLLHSFMMGQWVLIAPWRAL